MTNFINEGLLIITQKMCIIALTICAFILLSSQIRTCPLIENGSKIYPFDIKFYQSSVLFLTAAAIYIVECDIWSKYIKPKNRLIQFLAELFIMTIGIIIVYALFWHPIVITTSIINDKLSVLTHKWLGSVNIYKKSIPICMKTIHSTNIHCNILSVTLLYHVVKKFGKNDLRRIRCSF
ncbi:uncharacterized protein LOC100575076 [Acyrthosiphon pisum]|uniref:Uncharacterized protein n=1 Tax=Acyrthosiphon pisum TaxID=7029 RepID=A0A8R2AAF3_ACYPI|nr:uncharacterized protein LOC100575076 [Acyrthosiphon pisum]|eukprot:XP_003240395.1 PREDICTED: uncharacterized protein LOC100575076 isoform X1 [Acyrthosiphon pisum]